MGIWSIAKHGLFNFQWINLQVLDMHLEIEAALAKNVEPEDDLECELAQLLTPEDTLEKQLKGLSVIAGEIFSAI